MEGKALNVLVTGANGFVGRALVEKLYAEGYRPSCAVRRATGLHLEMPIGDIGPWTDWSRCLAYPLVAGGSAAVHVVIHLAARVHVIQDKEQDPLAAFRRVNVDGTLNLARQAARAGVRRFVFVSSVKVNGEVTILGRPFTERDVPRPVEPYAVSKYEAEEGLLALASATDMEVVIIRPPLVYGPGVKANFLAMMKWLYKGVPLPLGAVNNRRSLVALDNLVDLIIACIDNPSAANEIFLVSDGEDLSTTELLKRMAAALGVPARLVPIPARVIALGATMLGQRAFSRKLLGSLQVDISKARQLLNWFPPVSVDEALVATAGHFLEHCVS